ncbi:MAG TPA: DUF1203 domain-containing protein [Caulobacteraceae bacterium]|nr:DUF1203 domain-containing protein [Caulobacteraceae bacterium]
MSYVVTGLPVETFRPLFGLSDEALAERGVVRCEARPGGRYPCRVGLDYATPGETLLLLNYEHLDTPSPYRSRHAIYVNERAAETATLEGELPPVLKDRIVSLRAFDADGMMTWAELVGADADLEAAIGRGLADPKVAYLHAHNAERGCYSARIERA